MMDEIDKIGGDVGFGYSKIAWFEDGEIHTDVQSSIVGRSAQVRSMDLGLGGAKRQRVSRITYQGEEYLIGADALLHSQTGVAATQTYGRIGSDEERILLLSLLARNGLTDVCIVTGLPVLAWESRHKLRRSWVGNHVITLGRREMHINVREVRTAWQPVMSLWDYALAFDGQQVKLANGMDDEKLRRGWLIVDPGHNTTDWAGVINLQVVEQYSGGARVGGRDILAVIQKAIEQKYGVHRSLAEIEVALRRGYLDVYNDRVDLLPLARSAAASLSAQVASGVSEAVGDGSLFYGILVTGGPAAVVAPAIQAACPHNWVVILDQLANARGAAKFAQGAGVFKLDKRG